MTLTFPSFGSTKRRLAALIVLAALACVVSIGSAYAQIDDGRVAEIEKRLDFLDEAAAAVEERLSDDRVDPAWLDRLRERMSEQRAEARGFVDELTADVSPLREQLDALGPAPEEGATEAADVAAQRADLAARLQAAEGRLKRAELAAKRADTLSESLAKRRRDALTQQLLAHGPTAFEFDVWSRALVEWPELANRLFDGFRQLIANTGAISATLFTTLVCGLIYYLVGRRGAVIPRFVRYLLTRISATRSPAIQILLGLAMFLARVVPLAWIAISVAYFMREFGDLGPIGDRLVEQTANGFVIILLVSATARIVFAPMAPGQRVYDLGDVGALRAWRATVVLVTVICVGRVVLTTAEAAGADLASLTIANLIVTGVAAPFVLQLARTVCPSPASQAQRSQERSGDDDEDGEDAGVGVALARFGRIAGTLVAIVAPASAALGYLALSRFVLERSALTAALLLALVLAYVIVKRLLEGPIAATEEGDAVGGVSSDLGQREGQPATRSLGLAPAMTALLLFFIGAPLFAMIWGASGADLRVLAVDLWEGVEIGDTTYSAVDVLGALTVFVVGLWITRFLQRILRRTVLPNTSLDPGAKTSLAAGLGYVGFFITALLAVSAAGLDLSNIALVAGALSVGIGFGLQNIVNNFVSGLILLVERPIKVGDWIVVGDQQGYVRRISVRATEIETFDRSSVIVPNSELISTAVLNWTHKNLVGRVILQVGVAYDSDPDRVVEILKDVGAQHPMVLRYPEPFVCLTTFGDNALNFELRVMIRDVNYMLSVKHALNMAIVKRFREEGVEIPFPQRDLHIKTSGQIGDILAAANGGTPVHVERPTAEATPRHREIEIDTDTT